VNWLDVSIVLVVAYFAWAGIRHGFLKGIAELGGIVISISIPFLLYIPGGKLLREIGLTPVYSDPVAFLIIWFLSLNLYFFLARRLYGRIPRGIRLSRLNRVFGAVPGFIRGIVVVALLVAICAVLSVPPVSQDVLDHSLFAPHIVNVMTAVTSVVADIFGEAVRNALGFFTVRPENEERIALGFQVEDPTIDPESEEQMLRLLNEERAHHGLRPLKMDRAIRDVARRHSVDMFSHGYFSHNSLDGSTPFDRMKKAGVQFEAAGENIALAPTVLIAHRGLMNSPGHRANILEPRFRRVGIGAARGGIRGIAFTQDFSD